MDEIAIKQRTKPFLSKLLRRADIGDDDDVFAAGSLNSLFAMQLVLFLEKEFQIRVESKDLNLDYFRTLRAIGQFVAGKLVQRTANT